MMAIMVGAFEVCLLFSRYDGPLWLVLSRCVCYFLDMMAIMVGAFEVCLLFSRYDGHYGWCFRGVFVIFSI